mmetsp:Transcript_15819/g.66659  ORF Transcript_15819/g.66659 Transcript_15819/m.66659 type:complete len:401 (+) Transcript_15819:1304-2506(+)
MRRVRGHVASLVVAVDGHVQAHQLFGALVVVAHLFGEVRRPVQVVVRRDQRTVLERVAVDGGRHGGELRDAVQRVLEHGLPVLGLVHALRVRLGELTLRLQRHDGHRKLRHGVRVFRERRQHVEHVFRDVRARPELRGQALHLRLRGDIPGEQEPQQTLGEGLAALDGGREPFLQVGDGVSPKPDALLRVQQRGLPDHAGDAAHAAHRHVHGDLTEGLVAVSLLDLLQALLLRGDGRGESLLDPARRRGVPSPGAAQESRGGRGGRRRVGSQTRRGGHDATQSARRRHGAFGATCGRSRARVWGVRERRRRDISKRRALLECRAALLQGQIENDEFEAFVSDSLVARLRICAAPPKPSAHVRDPNFVEDRAASVVRVASPGVAIGATDGDVDVLEDRSHD